MNKTIDHSQPSAVNDKETIAEQVVRLNDSDGEVVQMDQEMQLDNSPEVQKDKLRKNGDQEVEQAKIDQTGALAGPVANADLIDGDELPPVQTDNSAGLRKDPAAGNEE